MSVTSHSAAPDAQAGDPSTELARPTATLHRASSGRDGDDLTRARLFCLAAGSEMSAIIDADRSPGGDRPARGRDPVWICERLDTIQRHAKRARARAIYRSAQDVMALIERCNAHLPIDWTRVDGRLFVLNKLLSQYEAGLDELLPQPMANAACANTPRPATDTQMAIARNTLSSVLPHATPDERAALSRLIAIDPTIETEPMDAPSGPNPVAPTGPYHTEPIDFMLPALMQRLLEVGQQYGKVLSLSHSLDDVWIAKSGQSDVEACLFDRLSELIAGSLPLQGVGRLDIGTAAKGFEISGSGFDTFTLLLPEGALATPGDHAAPDPLTETPPPPPMITAETEGDLRAQLAALMDGGLMCKPGDAPS
ncbi:hypothetical protein ACFFUB_11280 [Algimonas porphyrae]|nr:hypothetical protein [Algimonas porphyrae]